MQDEAMTEKEFKSLIENGDVQGLCDAIFEDADTPDTEKLASLSVWEGDTERVRELRRNFDFSKCEHKSVLADNYGESCAVCRKQLRGYGFGGWFGSNLSGAEKCIHDFVEYGDSEKICRFCERCEPQTPLPSFSETVTSGGF